MMGVGASEFAFMWIVMLGGFGLPLGLPPEAEDPLLARIAPPECLVYGTWAGMAQPNAMSANQTERLLAEPDVQRAIRGIERMIRQAAAGGGPGGLDGPRAFDPGGPPPEAMLALEWGLKVATRSGAIYLSKLDIPQKKIEAGAIFRLGEEDAANLKRLIIQFQQQAGGDVEATEVKIGSETFFRLKFKEEAEAPPVTWGVKKNYVVVGVGENALEGMLARAVQPTVPAWLVAARKKAGLARLSTLTYVNVKGLIAAGGPQLAHVLKPEAMQALGVANLTDVVSATGLDETGFVSRTIVGVEGELEGLLATLIDEPLTAADLGPIPADATVAFAGRLSLEKLLKRVIQITGEIEPRAAGELERDIARFESETGLDLRGELLPGLGDAWRVWISPSEGGFLSPTMVVNIRDRDRVQNALARLEALVPAVGGGFGPPGRFPGGAPRVSREKLGNLDIVTMRLPFSPFAPSWCVTDKELIFSSYPQTIRGYLRRGADHKSLAGSPEVAAALKEGASVVTYTDTRRIVEAVYPFAQMFITMGGNSAGGDLPFDFDPGILPPLSSIRPHLRPGVGVVRRTAGGVEFTSRHTLPGVGLTSISPVGLGLLLPAVQSARGAARSSQSMNNMKQILLAMHNHADAFKAFPGAFTMKADEKPLLSWRVRILPFIEQDNLFRQFKLDEPWDSEHNKALLEQMPATYRDPASAAPPGHTTYLGVRGKQGAFEKGDLVENGQIKKSGGIGFNQITDGTSNTIGIVAVADAAAVPWTKPDDFDFAMADFEKTLFGGRREFIAGMLDGSVRRIFAGTPKETLKAAFTRDGGEVVNLDDRGGPGESRAEATERIPETRLVPEPAPPAVEKKRAVAPRPDFIEKKRAPDAPAPRAVEKKRATEPSLPK